MKVKVVSAFFQDELQEVFTRLGCKVSASELGKVLKDADANKAAPCPFSVAVAVRYFFGPLSHSEPHFRKSMFLAISKSKNELR